MDIKKLLADETVRKCKLGEWLSTQSDEDTAALTDALESDYPHASLCRVFSRMGFETNPKAVLRHRNSLLHKGEKCACQ